jgi:hypothetical protein
LILQKVLSASLAAQFSNKEDGKSAVSILSLQLLPFFKRMIDNFWVGKTY